MSATQYNDSLMSSQIRCLGHSHSYGSRIYRSCLLEVPDVRNLVAEVCVVYVVFSQDSVIWRSSCKDNGSAQMISATTTVKARLSHL